MPRRIGFLFECGPDGPDVKVCRRLVELMDCEVEFIPRTLDNKRNLIDQCGSASKLLLRSCDRVLIVWDLYPPWRQEKPCLHQDRMDIFNSLNTAGVDLERVALVCIHEELEAWLIADDRALFAFIERLKHPYQVKRPPNIWRKQPDKVKKPKAELSKLFQRELGRSHRYIDFQHAEPLAKMIQDLRRLRRSPSFQRFHAKVCN